eukprot:TRINITY_DN5210_c0_g1_i1.p1 TRINITY_DN5210_c0_g1~~TRINITY_DN5210_c0_g1_i1.p1  ORF type:complete len:396 (-),score=83.11 TRINITY_DN5210_c0_g1_i1:65-1252(-)
MTLLLRLFIFFSVHIDVSSDNMGLFDWGFLFFEYTGNKIFEFYDLVTNPPIKVHFRRKRNARRAPWYQRIKQVIGIGSNTHRLRIRETSREDRLKPNKPRYTYSNQVAVPPPASAPPGEPIKTFVTDAVTSISTNVVAAPQTEKISKLETELSELRARIANIMVTSASSMIAPPSVETEELPAPPSDDTFADDLPPADADVAEILEGEFELDLDHLPPPDPSILETFNCFYLEEGDVAPAGAAHDDTASTPVMKTYQYKVVNHQDFHTGTSFVAKRAVQKPGGAISLSDILSQSTNLKPVDRSPGGTPIRIQRSPVSKGPMTSQDLIALALKKKFKTMNRSSPDSSPEGRPSVGRKSLKSMKTSDSEWDDKENCYGENNTYIVVDNDNRAFQLSH